MKQHEHIRLLLRKSAQDIAVMERLRTDLDIEDETIGFHAQQAVEKALKAWLVALGVDYPKLHNLDALMGLLEAEGHALPVHLAGVGDLTPFATVFRYEDFCAPTVFDREGALRTAREIHAFVQAQIAGWLKEG